MKPLQVASFILVIVFAVVLRIPQLGGSFWLDEAAQALQSARPLSQQLSIKDDFQPPLLHLITHVALVFSDSEWWLRSWGALLPGILSILGSMLLLKRLVAPKYALTAPILLGLLLATQSFHVFFSQELRPYMLAVAFAVWSWYFLISVRQRKIQTLGWIITTLLGLYSSYVYVFLFVSQIVYLALTAKAKQRKNWIVAFSLIVAGYLPWVPSFLGQLEAGQLLRLQLPNWEVAVSSPQAKALPLLAGKLLFGVLDLEISLPYILATVLIVILTSIVVVKLFGSYQKTLRKRSVSTIKTMLQSNTLPLLIWLLLPILFAWLVSFFVPVLQPKRVLFVLPALYLLLTLLLTKAIALQGWWTKTACTLVGLVLIINLISLSQYYSNPKLQREPWREVLTSLTTSHPQSFTLSSFPGPFAPIEWYRPKLISSPMAQDLATGTLYIRSQEEAEKVLQSITLAKLSTTMVYFEYLTDLTDPNFLLRTEIEGSGYQLTNLLDYPGIGMVRVYEYQQHYAARF